MNLWALARSAGISPRPASAATMPEDRRPNLYRCSKAGATVREGVELSSTKVGRLAGKSIVGISEERTTDDGVARARLDSRADDLEGGWVSKWVLKPMDEDSQPPPPPPMEDPAGPWLELEDGCLEIDGLKFTNDFCSGNLACVRKGHDGVLELAARRDNQGTPFESRHCAWLYFRVEDRRKKSTSVTLRVRSASRQAALYRAGYRPVERDGSCRRNDGSDWASLSGDAGWQRIAQHSFRWNECPDVVPPDTPSKRKSRYAQKRSDLDTPKALLEWDAEFPPSAVPARLIIFSRVASMASGGGQTVGGLFSILGPFEPFPAQAASSSSPSATRIRMNLCVLRWMRWRAPT